MASSSNTHIRHKGAFINVPFRKYHYDPGKRQMGRSPTTKKRGAPFYKHFMDKREVKNSNWGKYPCPPLKKRCVCTCIVHVYNSLRVQEIPIF